MLMPDVNILIYAHREEEKCHEVYAAWLKTVVDGPEPFALSSLVAVGFVRIVTNRRIYEDPTPLPIALAFIEQMTSHPRCRTAVPSGRHYHQLNIPRSGVNLPLPPSQVFGLEPTSDALD
jgi:toxin-antitoxin system PIN domain toxin